MEVQIQRQREMADRFDDAASKLGAWGRRFLSLPEPVRARAQEIRLRVGRPAAVSLPENEWFVTTGGALADSPDGPDVLRISRRELDEVFRLLCANSVYSHQQEIRNGFLVLAGGHRAGLCGTAVLKDGRVDNVRDISTISLRVARQIKGAADGVMRAVVQRGEVLGTLIFGPPGCGKTTVLRDLARQLSSGRLLSRRARVAVVDERGELAASWLGTPQNDLGPCCDVLNGYPKGEGMMQAVRALSPDVLICDELGGGEDVRGVEESLNAGVTVIASVHAAGFEELGRRPQGARLLRSRAFRCAVQLRGRRFPGAVENVYALGEPAQKGVDGRAG